MNSPFKVKVTVRNEEKGIPIYTEVSINNFDTRIQFIQTKKEISQLDSTSQDLVFEAFINTKSKSIKVTFDLYWVNFDETTDNKRYEFVLEGQDENIDWDYLYTQSPHDLNKVTKKQNLLGRKALIEKIQRSFNSPSLGVFYITGQKRVGKSSIAEVIRDIYVRKEEYICFYMETGDFLPDDENPRRTIRSLAQRICKSFKNQNPKFSLIPVPDFENGFSEISEFLDTLKRIEPTQKMVIIVDEFDELPRDVYGLGPIGKSFFKTLKALAGRRFIGLILVGGEKMKVVTKNVGQYINTSLPLKVDSFNKEKEYEDFVELVRKPTPQLIYEVDAIEKLYEFSSGNPFFAKKILMTLYSLVVERRNSVIDVELVIEAFETSLKEDGEPAFSHFWSDGIITAKMEEEDIMKMNRVKCLLSFATIFNNQGKVPFERLIKYLVNQGFEENKAKNYIKEFLDRGVLYRNREELLDIRNVYFKTWLINYGIEEISDSFSNPDEIEKYKKREAQIQISASEILEIQKRFSLYNGKEIGAEHIRAWLSQFGGNSNQRLILPLIKNISFFDQAKIEEACELLFKRIQRWYLSGDRRVKLDISGEKLVKKIASKITVSTLDEIGKSGMGVLRTFIKRNNIYKYQIKDKNKLEFGPNDVIVFIDDFIASGKSMTENLRELFKNKKIQPEDIKSKIFLCAIVGFTNSANKLETEFNKYNIKVEIANELSEADKCFSKGSKIFRNDVMKEESKELCLSKGLELEKNNPLGFSGCQSLIVFHDNCPNNTLPIIYKKTKNWTPLFERR